MTAVSYSSGCRKQPMEVIAILLLGACAGYTHHEVQTVKTDVRQQQTQLTELREGVNSTREAFNGHSARLDKLEGYCFPSGNGGLK